MRNSLIILIYVCILLLLYASPCTAAEKPVVFVSILPQKFFVQQICKDLVEVEVMVQPGASPATYEPKPSQMAKLSSSSLYLAIGVPFERSWLEKFSAINPAMTVVHTDKGIKKIAMAEHLHDEGPEQGETDSTGEDLHDHGILDPHIWLSPTLVKRQAKVLRDTFVEIIPQKSEIIEKNFVSFVNKIDALDTELRTLFRDKEGLQFMVFHPSWGYFAKEYGLEQVAIEMEGKEPKPGQLKALITHAKTNDIRIIFVQRQFSKKNAQIVAREIGGEVIAVDPLAEDWFANMQDVAEKIKLAIK